MSLGMRKLAVAGAISGVFLLANAWAIVSWLSEKGLVDWAAHVHSEWLTGTAIAIIVTLLVLLTPARQVVTGGAPWLRRCPVCDHVLLRKGRYCPECGGRV